VVVVVLKWELRCGRCCGGGNEHEGEWQRRKVCLGSLTPLPSAGTRRPAAKGRRRNGKACRSRRYAMCVLYVYSMYSTCILCVLHVLSVFYKYKSC